MPSGAAAQPRPTPRTPGSLQIHVRGVAELHAVATIDHDELTVHGELIDDAGTPIGGAPVFLAATQGDGTHTTLHLGAPQGCGDDRGRVPGRGGPDEVGVETDERGGFCAIGRVGALGPKATLSVRFRGKGLYDPAEISVPIEAVHEHLMHIVLRFEPAPETLDLERESLVVTAGLRVERGEALPGRLPGASGSAQRANLPLVLTDERGAHVAEAVTGGDGRARFDVKTSLLAGPGAGELTVHFAGNAVLEAAEWSQPVIRRAEVHMALTHPIERGDPEDGIAFDLDVTAAGRPVSGGIVEVRHLASSQQGGDAGPEGPPSSGATAGQESTSLGAASVDDAGHAHLVAVFSGLGAAHAPLALRYIPAAPWYRAGPTLQVDAPLAQPGIGRSILLAVLVIAAATWVVIGWRRSPPRPIEPGLEPTRVPPSGKAGVRVVAQSNDAGWRGTVADAHDGSPIAGARLSIVVPSFEGDGVILSAVSDEQGAFELEGSPSVERRDARLVVESAEHAKHEQPLPPPSVLAVALVTRRRALLERLVRWARRRGAPFDSSAEPTPGHVRRVASRNSVGEVEAWATKVEDAVYGPEKVTASVEQEVRAVEPRAVALPTPPAADPRSDLP